ncbi:MAG: hypothetical protein HUJ58_09075, partial [Erysipelotrichaceae bacterium]|nr:hypothetical protein [Erysipelotrichaceae bacterium]
NRDYTVSYANNHNASTAENPATVTVVLTGNYEGSKTVPFTITKASFTANVLLSDWTYDRVFRQPQLDSVPSGSGAVTYYYVSEGQTATTVQPVNAGTYTVYAVIAGNDNYEEVTTAEHEFTINKREITIRSNDDEFLYDGLPHSNNGYSIEGTFATGEGFLSISVTGTQTNVTTEEDEGNNTISYKLNSVTAPNADNYIINLVCGTLTVLPRQLSVPYGHGWDSKNPGSLSYVAVSRSELTVSYKVWLYAYDGQTYTPISLGADGYAVAEGNRFDMSAAIRAHAEAAAAEGKVYSYSYGLQTIPTGGNAKNNYSASEILSPEDSTPLYVAQVMVQPDSQSVLQATINGDTVPYILLQNEKIALHATAIDGYVFASDNPWITGSEFEVVNGTRNDSLDEITGMLHAVLTESSLGNIVRISSVDEAPAVTRIVLTNNEDLTEVTFTVTAVDTYSVTHWMITESATAPEATDPDWTAFAGVDGQFVAEDTFTSTVDHAGAYYVYVKDNSGNVSCYEEPVYVYRIHFEKGNEEATGTMADRIKGQHTTVKLPENTFELSG